MNHEDEINHEEHRAVDAMIADERESELDSVFDRAWAAGSDPQFDHEIAQRHFDGDACQFGYPSWRA